MAVECDDYTPFLTAGSGESMKNMSASDILFGHCCNTVRLTTTASGLVRGRKSTGAEFEYKTFDVLKAIDYMDDLQPDYYKDLHFFSAEALASPAP